VLGRIGQYRLRRPRTPELDEQRFRELEGMLVVWSATCPVRDPAIMTELYGPDALFLSILHNGCYLLLHRAHLPPVGSATWTLDKDVRDSRSFQTSKLAACQLVDDFSAMDTRNRLIHPFLFFCLFFAGTLFVDTAFASQGSTDPDIIDERKQALRWLEQVRQLLTEIGTLWPLAQRELNVLNHIMERRLVGQDASSALSLLQRLGP
jgi:hypothetical protein